MADASTSKGSKEVQVQLYVRGQGPVHEFISNLKGWEPNRLDVNEIKEKYGMKSLFAFSIISGRGLELAANPRNGLSLITYRGLPGTVIRLDGEPRVCIETPSFRPVNFSDTFISMI